MTLCTFDRGCHFEMFGQLRHIIEAQWYSLPERFPCVVPDEFVIMPNHFHGIIIICRDTPCGNPYSVHSQSGYPRGVPLRKPNIGDIVGSFKSLCVNAWLKNIKRENINARGRFWQDNYYEHIIRNDDEMERIRRYIAENPLRWELDRENPANGRQWEQHQVEQWMV